MTGRQQADLTRMRAKFTRLQAEAERYKTENAELKVLLQSVVSFAVEAHEKWDADEDPRVGKMLRALAGGCPGYRPDTDAIHEALKP